MQARVAPAGFWSALRDAALHGREPEPRASVAARPNYRWMVVGTVCIGAFMGQLDASIAQQVLPRLEEDFHARLSAVSWVAVAYLLTVAALLPIFGRLADIRGRKLFYTGGFLLFVLGSALCALSPSIGALIGSRILQAVGASMMQANSVAIIVANVRPEERGRALGLQATAQAIGLSLGPALGGMLLQVLDWRSVFWLNLPVGLAAATIAWWVLPTTADTDRTARLDLKGAFLLVPALVALLLAINESHNWGGILAPAPLATLAVALGFFIAFFRLEPGREFPLIDPRLLRTRRFTIGSLAGTASYGMLFGVFFLMPFVFGRVYGDAPIVAGAELAVVPLAIGLMAPLSGALSERLDARLLTIPGMICSGAGLLWMWRMFASGAPPRVGMILAIALVGLGQGLFVSPNNRAIISAAPRQLRGVAGGVMNLFRTIGMSLGVAGSLSVMSWRLASLTGEAHVLTMSAPPRALSAASASVSLLLAGFALAALVLSLLPGRQSPSEGPDIIIAEG
ncbi:MAG: MFS transporter [Alphaproteobacteria bacterium]|nr:MFS transporter [Alphaproteobacteria bacterium]